MNQLKELDTKIKELREELQALIEKKDDLNLKIINVSNDLDKKINEYNELKKKKSS